MSRRTDAQAIRILQETKRIVSTVRQSLGPAGCEGRRTAAHGLPHELALATLKACLQDVEHMLEGCGQRDVFDLVYRNYGAQQALILREQQSWTARSPTERVFFVADNAVFLSERSQSWISTRMRS